MSLRLFRRRSGRSSAPALPVSPGARHAQLDALGPADSRVAPADRVALLWSNALGRNATRAAQILLVLVLTGVAVVGLAQVSVVVLPLLIALILTSAMWPLVMFMRRHLSSMLAACTVFLGSLVVLGGIGTAIVFAVRA